MRPNVIIIPILELLYAKKTCCAQSHPHLTADGHSCDDSLLLCWLDRHPVCPGTNTDPHPHPTRYLHLDAQPDDHRHFHFGAAGNLINLDGHANLHPNINRHADSDDHRNNRSNSNSPQSDLTSQRDTNHHGNRH